MITKSKILVSLVVCFLSSAAASSHAKEITILYTGETHAMLYPCNCPKEPDGGITRRATLIRQLRGANPDTLVLDSGGFFAGGIMDEYTQNTELDKERTSINLRAMELMQYDAAAIGDDEFNFGREFLQENIGNKNFAFLSSNIKSDKIVPYIIKEVAGSKIGIIGVTALSAMQKAGGLVFVEPKTAVKGAAEALRKQGVNVIVLLSHLGESEDLRLIDEIAGIDIVISAHAFAKEEPSSKINSTLLLRPSWQGRLMGKLTFTLKDNKIADYKVETLRLSDKINDDPGILSVLPRCFSDANCRKEGLVGRCIDAGTINSRCLFSEPVKINLSIITPKTCSVCDTERITNYLKGVFPGLEAAYLYYPDAKANKMIKDFDIKALPAYFLSKEIEKEKAFSNLKDNVDIKGDLYMLKPEFSGISYFLDRKRIKGKLDLFLSLNDKSTTEVLEAIKEYNPVVRFLAVEQQDGFDTARGNLEVEEYLRSVCVQKYYPQIFWDYISCRAKNINSSWWEDCLGGSDVDKIKTCARGTEGVSLLKENIGLGKELKVMFGPVYLLENQEVFGTQGTPSKEDLKRIMKR